MIFLSLLMVLLLIIVSVISYIINSRVDADKIHIGQVISPWFDSWFKEHPKSKEIFELVRNGRLSPYNIDQIGKDIIRNGAKVAILSSELGQAADKHSFTGHYFIITDEMVLAGDEKVGADLYAENNRNLAKSQIRSVRVRNVERIEVPVKAKSVSKSAVVGGLIAGGAGAVVGALAAADHNQRKAGQMETKTFYSGGLNVLGVYYHWYCSSGCFRIDKHFSEEYRVFTAKGIGLRGYGAGLEEQIKSFI